MRIVSCDDEPVQSIYVKDFAAEWQRERGIPCTITVYGSAEEFLLETDRSFPYDLALLDIEMNKISGMELAKKIRAADSKAAIAFLTAKKEYVFEGYEVQALRYLMKPLQKEAFFSLLDQVQAGLSRTETYLILNLAGESRKIETNNIRYLEAVGHYVEIHTKSEVLKVRESLASLQKQLPQGQFAPAHRSYTVNLHEVVKITRTECLLTGGAAVPVSRNLYQPLNEAFLSYYKREEGML